MYLADAGLILQFLVDTCFVEQLLLVIGAGLLQLNGDIFGRLGVLPLVQGTEAAPGKLFAYFEPLRNDYLRRWTKCFLL